MMECALYTHTQLLFPLITLPATSKFWDNTQTVLGYYLPTGILPMSSFFSKLEFKSISTKKNEILILVSH